MRSPTAITFAAGAAFRTVAGRSPFHTHLKESTNAKTWWTTASEAMQHYHSCGPARRPHHCAMQQGRTSVPNNLTSSRRLLSTKAAPSSTANPTEQKPPPPPPHRKSSFISPRYAAVLIVLAVAGVAWDSQWLFPSPVPSDPAHRTVLGDARKFVRFDVVGREQVSPTSFILTLKAPAATANHPSLSGVSSLWDVFDLWCVEVKQPQIQVAREYTPLPPLVSAPESGSESAADGTDRHHHHQHDKDTLRLYVRAVRGGEVSTYLSRLSPPAVDASGSGKVWNGDTVELRGPHGEFDLRSRLGASGDRVVFLAGGTGIASALQTAHAVLPLLSAPSMTIFWAVRSRDEIQGVGVSVGVGSEVPRNPPASSSSSSWLSWSSWNPFSRQPEKKSAESVIQAAEALSTRQEGSVHDPSPITRELLALKRKYGDRLDVRFVVDEEGTRVREPDLAATLLVTRNSSIKRADSSSSGEPATATECKFHSRDAHVSMIDGAPNAGKRLEGGDCACLGPRAAKGKNLLVVSGPEGFVQAYAGPKVWQDGGQLQGAVGGMLGRMQKGDPGLLRDWIVLKL